MGEGPLLPLFPLPVVLFPGAPLPLHIFEERYRLMVGQAARDHSEFGVLLVHDGKLSAIGCTATVERVVRQYEDGRFDVETVGGRRFRTLTLDQTQSYFQAQVEFFDDQAAAPLDGNRLKQVTRLSRKIAAALKVSLPDVSQQPRPSFQIAQHLPLELAFKQDLLERRSENERLEALASHLEKLSQRLDTIRRTQRVAGANGQAGPH